MELNWAPESPWADDITDVAGPPPAWPVAPPVELGPTVPVTTATGNAAGPPEEPGDAEQNQQVKGPALPWLRQVSFRSRISILVGAAVGIAVALAALVSYVAVSRQLERQETSNLQNAIASATGLVHQTFQGPTISPQQVFNFENQTGDSVQVITQTRVYSLESGQPSTTRFFPMTKDAAQVLKSGPGGDSVIETLTATN